MGDRPRDNSLGVLLGGFREDLSERCISSRATNNICKRAYNPMVKFAYGLKPYYTHKELVSVIRHRYQLSYTLSKVSIKLPFE